MTPEQTTGSPASGTEAILVATSGAAPQEHLHLDDSAIKRVGALAVAAAAVRQVGNTTQAIIPEGFKLQDLTKQVEAAGEHPFRKTGTVALADVKSFNTFVAEQSDLNNCYIYADPEQRRLTAVLNDHPNNDGQAGWRDFRATYTAELSREFATWLNSDGKKMDQEAFAVFLEDNLADIVEPSGEILHAVALTLQAKTAVNFSSHKRLDNGQVQLGYSEEITATAGGDGKIDIPREFAIGTRLFKNGQGYKIKARLKYRLGQGKVSFWYELDRPENVIEQAFEDYIDAARVGGRTVLLGKP